MYTDADPNYRDTPVYSGIPPPSLRDVQGYSRYNEQHNRHYNNTQPHHKEDLSRYNPQRQFPSGQRSNSDSRYQPYPSPYDTSRGGESRSYHQQRSDPYQQQQHYYPVSSQLQPVTSEAPPQPPSTLAPATKPAPKLDMRTSTDFIECDSSNQLTLLDLCAYIQVAPTKVDYDFLCSNDLVKTAIELGVKGSQVPGEVRAVARTKSNPFDCIDKHIFMNRDAMKLAALDATFQLTPTDNTGKTFMFADLCGGPGGFTEYLFWRMHQQTISARGYGMTLQSTLAKTQDHWHLELIPQHITVNFTQVDGIDGSGDLYRKNNILEFDAVISNNTKKRGVDLVVADGGYQEDSKGGKGVQLEHATQRLMLCEVITMLTCLKQDGTFVCKCFDIFEEFTADLVWLLYQLFGAICITKPLTSDPTSSERYLVCKRLRFQHPTRLIDALLQVNNSFDGEEEYVKRFVPREVLEKDETFSDYVKMRNMKFLLKQIDALEQMETHIADPNRPALHSPDKVKSQCLQEWNL
ncbi:FtsJ-like methyltransferase-domain-containing protein [Chlamydoabsidia padenii]|nr:FtsJ-like methyltransferase-domain-containing protein [Chlamydoabsidia padenii]